MARHDEPLLDESTDDIIDVDVTESTSRSNKDGATALQATFNLVNIYMGLGLLSQAYTLRMAGWSGLLALAATTGIFCLSAKLLIRCMEKLPEGLAHTYPNLGVKAFGPVGKYVIAAFTVLEFFCGSCITLLVIWREVVELLPDHQIEGWSPFAVAVIASVLFMVPVMFLPSFKVLSYLNLAGCLSTVLVTVTVMASMLLDLDRSHMPQQPPAEHSLLRLGMFQAIGIYALSVSGHSSLPVLRKSMKEPKEFDKVLDMGFGTMLVLYALVAGCGYYYWGNQAHTLLTTDLKLNSRLSGQSILLPGLTMERLVSACILVNACTTYPNLVMVIQDMLCSVTKLGGHGAVQPPYLAGALIRLSCFIIGATLSYSAYAVLGNIMSLSGGICSISCSLLLPSICFLLLYRRDMRSWQVAATAGILLLGIALLLLITWQNLRDIAAQAKSNSLGLSKLSVSLPILFTS